jgi:uncharacterized protein YaiI (UPF0178 family)
MTEIYIDADACPVREEVYRVAARYGLTVHVVSNGSRPIRPVPNPAIKMIIVGEGADAADDWIADRISPADVCITADIPLASRCLAKGARAVAHNGRHWTTDNIGSALAGREIGRHLREMGVMTGSSSAFARQDRSRFLVALDTAVTAAMRPAR